MRPSGRAPNQLRAISLEAGVSRYAEGSCLAVFGHTRVLCTASVEERLPPWMRKKGLGWVTAEYGMLPRSTSERTRREAKSPTGQAGRTQEIQRLIGRVLRGCVDAVGLGEIMIVIDCDVLQADGGTRTAAITGGWVALAEALDRLAAADRIGRGAMVEQVAAVSCGVVRRKVLLDLDYDEDSGAEVDANFALTRSGQLLEVQASAEAAPFSDAQFTEMRSLARTGCETLFRLQNEALAALKDR